MSTFFVFISAKPIRAGQHHPSHISPGIRGGQNINKIITDEDTRNRKVIES